MSNSELKDTVTDKFNIRVFIIILGCMVSALLFLPIILINITDLLGLDETTNFIIEGDYAQMVFMIYVFEGGWIINALAIFACIGWNTKQYIKWAVIIVNIIPFTAIVVALPLLLP